MTSSTPAHSDRSRAYRLDVDGLRGVAIALVVIFHIWLGKVSGGVDVFLTVSGYFFVGSLIRNLSSPTTSLNPLPQISRLARRLLPALIVVVTATVALSTLVRPETQWRGIFEQAVASLTYNQNWFLATTSQEYAAAGSSISPLQHLWSMSVQGQFFLAAIIIMFLFAAVWRSLSGNRRTSIALTVVAAAAAAVSMTWAVLRHNSSQGWAYYDTGARAWEILVGGLAAMFIAGVVLPKALRLIFTVTGLAMVVSCGFLIDGGQSFPGPLAWYPVGGALLLIIGGAIPAGEQPRLVREPVTWFLSQPPVVCLGTIAYSLYLWHWPLLISWLSWQKKDSVELWDGLALVVVSILLAVATERFIEKPLRMPSRVQSGSRTPAAAERDRNQSAARLRARRVPVALTTAMVVLLAGAVFVRESTWSAEIDSRKISLDEHSLDDDHPGALAFTDGAPVPDDVNPYPSFLQIGSDLPRSTTDKCISNFNTETVITCVYGDREASQTIALVGASHAEHWLPALDQIGRERGFKVVTILKMACPLTLDRTISDVPGAKSSVGCRTWGDEALGTLLALKPDYVFTTATRPNGRGPDYTPGEYADLWAWLSSKNIGVLAVRDTPWLSDSRGAFRADDCLASGGTPLSCGRLRAEVISPVNPAEIVASTIPNVHVLDLTDALCDAKYCPAIVGNVIVYHDSHHLSATFVRSMGTELARQIGTATRWW